VARVRIIISRATQVQFNVRELYAITRIDDDKFHTHSWVVTIQRKGKKFHRSFSDMSYGDKSKALTAAMAYRDDLLSRYSPFTLKEYCSIRKKNNRSGVSGICLHVRIGKDGESHRYWIARWSPEPGKAKAVKFSVKKYGEEEAFRKAVLARMEALEQMNGYFDPGTKRRGTEK
jgi:hypothetical protein